MKTIITFALILTVVTAQAQSKTYLSGGLSYNAIENMNVKPLNSMGYYAGIGESAVIRKWTVNTELQLLHQRIKNDQVKASASSANIMVYGGPQIFNLPVKIFVGGQMGFTFASSVEVNDVIVKDKGPRFSLIGGLAYQLQRYHIIAKYYRTVDGKDPMDFTLQAGVNYQLRK